MLPTHHASVSTVHPTTTAADESHKSTAGATTVSTPSILTYGITGVSQIWPWVQPRVFAGRAATRTHRT